MQNVVAYTSDYNLSNYEDLENPLTVTCAGYYQNYNGEIFQCHRKFGRLDYLIMYCHRGEEYFIDNEMEYKLSEGSLCIFSPGEPQYLHYNLNNSHVYWVHFTGYNCKNLLKYNGLEGQKLFNVGKNTEFSQTIIKIANEILLKRTYYDKACSALMSYLMMLLGRSIKEKKSGFDQESIENMSKVIAFINGNYSRKITIDSLASIVNMSKFTFIRNFKNLYNYTPIEYLIHVRIQHAQELLEGTKVSIKNVSLQVGYDNPFYFSRLFKKVVGISPEAYMLQNRV